MRKIEIIFAEYSHCHQNQFNKTIHWICTPAIFFGLVGLFFSIPPLLLETYFPFMHNFANWATFFLIMVAFYYATLSPPLALGMILFSSICLAMVNLIHLVSPIPLWMLSLFIFGMAWFLQLYGQKVEGKKIPIYKNFQFIFIGPAWLMHIIYKKFGFAYK